jgi:hypothetical protein
VSQQRDAQHHHQDDDHRPFEVDVTTFPTNTLLPMWWPILPSDVPPAPRYGARDLGEARELYCDSEEFGTGGGE